MARDTGRNPADAPWRLQLADGLYTYNRPARAVVREGADVGWIVARRSATGHARWCLCCARHGLTISKRDATAWAYVHLREPPFVDKRGACAGREQACGSRAGPRVGESRALVFSFSVFDLGNLNKVHSVKAYALALLKEMLIKSGSGL